MPQFLRASKIWLGPLFNDLEIQLFTCKWTVHSDEKAVVSASAWHNARFVEYEGAEAGSGCAQGRVDYSGGDGHSVPRIGDTAL